MDSHASPQPATPEPDDRVPIAAAFLSGLLKLVRILRLYPTGHPLIEKASEEVRQAWAALRASTEEIALDRRTDSLVVDGTEAVRCPRSLDALDRLLAEKQVETLAVSGTATDAAILDLAASLAGSRDPGTADPVPPESMPGVSLLHVGTAPAATPGLTRPAAGAPSISRLLAGALPRTEAALAMPAFQGPQPQGADTTADLESLRQVRETLHRDPLAVAYRVAVAVNELLAGAENPSTEDLLRAFARAIERVVTARLDETGGGLAEAEDTARRIVAAFAPAFVRRMLRTRPDGGFKMDRLLQRFTESVKLRILRAAVRDRRLDRGGFCRVIESLTADEAEEDGLLTRLTQELSRDGDLADEHDRLVRIIGSSARGRRRRGIVLLLASDADAAGRVHHALEEDELTVHVLDDGERLVGEVERLNPDVVVLDPQQRGIPGLPLIARLRRTRDRSHPVPLIVFTRQESFRHEFEVKTYPGCRFVLAREGLDRLRACIQETLAAGRTDDAMRGIVVHDDYRPAPEIANRHLFVPRFEILTYFDPGTEESATYFDVVHLDPARTAILLADGFRPGSGPDDPCGKVRAGMSELLGSASEPRRLIHGLNELFHDHFGGRPLITAHALLVDSERGSITSCLAGGMRPVRVDAFGDSQEIALPSGIILGFSRATAFENTLQEWVLPMGAGDTVLVYSHGLAVSLGDGEKQRAFGRLRREIALAYHETRAPDSPLLRARDRLAAALREQTGFRVDRAAIWIRSLEREPRPIHTVRARPTRSRRGLSTPE